MILCLLCFYLGGYLSRDALDVGLGHGVVPEERVQPEQRVVVQLRLEVVAADDVEQRVQDQRAEILHRALVLVLTRQRVGLGSAKIDPKCNPRFPNLQDTLPNNTGLASR